MIKKIDYANQTQMALVRSILVVAMPKEILAIDECLNLLFSNERNLDKGLVSSTLYGYFSKEGKLIGVCGLYSIEEDSDIADWVSWFATRSEYRSLGIGRKMLDFLFSETTKKFLRVYTNFPESKPFWEKYFDLSYLEESDSSSDGFIYYYEKSV